MSVSAVTSETPGYLGGLPHAEQSFDLPLEGPRICFDTQLSEAFTSVDVNEQEVYEVARDMGVGAADISKVHINFSSQARVNAGVEGYVLGHYSASTVHIFLGSHAMVAAERPVLLPADEHREALLALSDEDFINNKANDSLAHELSHAGSEAIMGREALDRETKRYERQALARAVRPATMIATANSIAVAGLCSATLEYTGTDLPVMNATIASCAVAGVALGWLVRQGEVRRVRNHWQGTFNPEVYRNEPEEIRARANAAAYMATNPTSLVTVQKSL